MTTPLHVERRLPDGFLADSLRADARAGLTGVPKSLPPKWFYDAAGSELFEKITGLPEHYPTRAEREILHWTAGEIAALSGAGTLVELGSGYSEKTRLLIDALRSAGTLRAYVPVDVSEPALVAAAQALLGEYPGLEVRAVVSDFEHELGLPPRAAGGAPRMVAFLGSTIGNMLPAQRAAFLARVRASLAAATACCSARPGQGPGGAARGVRRRGRGDRGLQQERAGRAEHRAGRRFRPGRLRARGRLGRGAGGIEMRLRAATAQTVQIPGIGLTARFGAGEEMRTEVSAKFRREGVTAELAAAGFELREWWTDAEGRFGLSLSVPA